MLALAVVLSGYERRTMSMLHNRDAPVVYLLLGLGQPIADAGKLVSKSMATLYHSQGLHVVGSCTYTSYATYRYVRMVLLRYVCTYCACTGSRYVYRGVHTTCPVPVDTHILYTGYQLQIHSME
jgi:hypothetical protein